MESEKVLNLRNFLSVPKPAIEKTDTIDSVTRTFVGAVQVTSEGRGGLENTENTAIKHEVLETNRREEPEENVKTGNIITESRHQKEASVEEVSTSVDDVKESEKEEAVVIESEVSEENSSEAVGEEKSLPVGEKKNVPQNEEVESDEVESDSSSDSDSSSSSSSSSSDSESDNDEREYVGRIRLDQVKITSNYFLTRLFKVKCFRLLLLPFPLLISI